MDRHCLVTRPLLYHDQAVIIFVQCIQFAAWLVLMDPGNGLLKDLHKRSETADGADLLVLKGGSKAAGKRKSKDDGTR